MVIPYGRQSINEADIAAVLAVLKSDYLTQGPAVPQFEARVAEETQAAHAVAVSNATCALHIACRALDVGPGDLVWTSPVTFVASANCALYCGADIDFVDIDPGSYNMCPGALAEKLEAASAAGRLPKVIIPVHLCGQSCDMEEIWALAQRYGISVIEDASHAIGGHYHGSPVGSCRFSDITVFSFHPVKIVTTAEGGMAVTQNPDLAAKMALLRSHGVTRDESLMTEPSHGPWYYQQIELGYNYRMTELQAALGLSQMDRLAAFVTRRNEIADIYDRRLSGLPLDRPVRTDDRQSALHLYVIQLHDPAQHRRLFEELRATGILVNLHYIPVHLQPWFRDMGFAEGDFPASEAYYRRAISLPMFPTMEQQQIDHVIDTLHRLLA